MGEGVVGLGEGLLGGAVLDPGGVEAGGELAVGVTHEADRDLPGVLGDGGVELVDVAGGEAELELEVLDGRARPDPELAVARVGEELVGVAVGERAEVQDGLVAGALAVVAGDGLEDEDGVGLAVGAEAGEPGEGGVRAEHVVGVVAADLEAAGGHDDALLRVRGAQHGTPLGGPRGGGGLLGGGGDPRGPVLAHEGAELVGGRPGAVVGLLLLFTHPAMLPRGPGVSRATPLSCRFATGGGPGEGGGMGRHTAPRRRGPLVVTGATAGLLTAPASSSASPRARHPRSRPSCERPGRRGAVRARRGDDHLDADADALDLGLDADAEPATAPPHTPDDGTASRSAPRSAPPTTSTATTSEKPTSSPTPSATEGGDLLGGLTGIPILP